MADGTYKFVKYEGDEMAALFDKTNELGPATTEKAGLLSAADKTKLDGISQDAEENVIEGVKLGDTALEPTEKVVTIPVDNAPTEGSSNLIRSGAVATAIAELEEEIEESAATFRGTFESLADLQAYSGEKNKNDYAYVETEDAVGNKVYKRYVYDGTQWVFEKDEKQTDFTEEQWAAINSGVTAAGYVGKANIADLESGAIVPALAGNLESWDGASSEVKDTFSGVVRTTAGDTSIESDEGGRLVSIVAKEDFAASEFRATGFNLLRDAEAVGNGYFFLVPALSFGVFGTAQAPNGVLFTDANGNNLRPTVLFKPLSQGKPTSASDGSVCSYVDSNGYRFYTTSQPGFLVVSGITLASTCAHIGWSRRYNEYVAVNSTDDAGSSISLTSILNAVHSDVKKLLCVGSVADRIDWLTDGTATWTRKVGLASPTWTTEEDEATPGQYTHKATISDMASGGSAALYADNSGVILTVDGSIVSYIDNSPTATSAKVKYELNAPATGTVALQNLYALEDWGLEKFRNVTGSAYVTTEYERGIPDTLAAIAATHMPDATQRLEDLEYDVEELEERVLATPDIESLPLICGQPLKLYGAGTPQASIVPTNWIQLADGGYNWNGIPAAIGQEYIDTTNGGKYEAVRGSNFGLKWLAV